MTTELPTTPLVGYISFTRTIRPADYESASMTVNLPVELQDTMGEKEILDAYENAAFLARTTVFAQLGLEAAVDEDTGVLVEVPKAVAMVTNAFPGSTVQNTAPAADASGVPANPPYPVGDFDHKNENQDWAKARFAVAPHEFYDNRGNKRNPKAPDIKHKATGVAAWDV